jgi:aryl-alcohol dehydrogenase (NADP+)
MVRSGKVRYIGFSNYTAWEACELLYTAKLHNLIAPVVAENPYNLITRGLDDEMTHFLEKYNVGLMIYNPLAGGLLTGKHTRGHLAENSRFSFGLYQDRYCSERNFDAIEQLSNIANSSGMSLLQLAMRWCLSQKIVNSTILGCSSIAQLKQNISLSEEGPLSEDILRECEKVWEMLKSQAYGYFFPWNGRKGQSKSGNLQG